MCVLGPHVTPNSFLGVPAQRSGSHDLWSAAPVPTSLKVTMPSVTPPNRKATSRGTWVAELAKHLTLNFRPGHDLGLRSDTEPHVGLRLSSEST